MTKREAAAKAAAIDREIQTTTDPVLRRRLGNRRRYYARIAADVNTRP